MDKKHQSESQEQDQFQSTQQNSSDITLVPYVLHNGQWTLPDYWLRLFAGHLRDEGTFDTVFYDGRVKTDDEFVSFMQNPNNFPIFAFRDDVCFGLGWLNGLATNYAYAHFVIRRSYWGGDNEALGRLANDYWFSFPGKDGPLLDFIFGMIPAVNKLAIRFVRKLGWTHLGTVPKMLEHSRNPDREDAVIFYISREDHGRLIKTKT